MGLKLNLGANVNLFQKPWINIDLELPPDNLVVAGVDGPWQSHFDFRQGDILSLDWLAPGTVDQIQADFVLEHLHIDHEVPDALYEWARILTPGGVIEVRVPNGSFYARAVIEWENRGGLTGWMKFRTANFELLNPVDIGPLGSGSAAFHKSIWTKRTAELLFQAQGFTVSVSEEGDPQKGMSTLVIKAVKGYTPAGATSPEESKVDSLAEAKVEASLKAARSPVAEPWKDVSNQTPLKALEEVKALPADKAFQQHQERIDTSGGLNKAVPVKEVDKPFTRPQDKPWEPKPHHLPTGEGPPKKDSELPS